MPQEVLAAAFFHGFPNAEDDEAGYPQRRGREYEHQAQGFLIGNDATAREQGAQREAYEKPRRAGRFIAGEHVGGIFGLPVAFYYLVEQGFVRAADEGHAQGADEFSHEKNPE